MSLCWIDSSVLIQSHHRLYPYTRDPRFWSWLDGQLDKGTIRMTAIAFIEVTDGNDWLVKWCRDRKSRGLNIRPTKDVQVNEKRVSAYVQSKYQGRNRQHLIDKFLSGADTWLIAHAMTDGGTVVTQEEPEKKHETLIKVPTVAKAMKANWCDTHGMLDLLRARFE